MKLHQVSVENLGIPEVMIASAAQAGIYKRLSLRYHLIERRAEFVLRSSGTIFDIAADSRPADRVYSTIDEAITAYNLD